jgi:mono/diheme cytochrome c family protein
MAEVAQAMATEDFPEVAQRLAPACPYPNVTQATRDDVADLFAHLRSRPAVRQVKRPHARQFPYGTQAALPFWRALYFRPGHFTAEPSRTADWDRGAYLVGGIGHCGACHGSRNAWGATDGALDLRGGEVPLQEWLAPALDDTQAAGVADSPLEQIVARLKTGISARASASGPVATVVARGTQFMVDSDLRAIASYLKSLPAAPRQPVEHEPLPPAQAELCARVYKRHCACCLGRSGEGSPGAVPALAGNRALALVAPDNLFKVVLGGAFAPATEGHPRPYGMPHFATLLSDDEVEAAISLVRNRWGGGAAPASASDINGRADVNRSQVSRAAFTTNAERGFLSSRPAVAAILPSPHLPGDAHVRDGFRNRIHHPECLARPYLSRPGEAQCDTFNRALAVDDAGRDRLRHAAAER